MLNDQFQWEWPQNVQCNLIFVLLQFQFSFILRYETLHVKPMQRCSQLSKLKWATVCPDLPHRDRLRRILANLTDHGIRAYSEVQYFRTHLFYYQWSRWSTKTTCKVSQSFLVSLISFVEQLFIIFLVYILKKKKVQRKVKAFLYSLNNFLSLQ